MHFWATTFPNAPAHPPPPLPLPYLLTGPFLRIFNPTFVIGKTPDDLKVVLVTPGCKTLKDIKNHKFSSSLQETESFKH